MTPYRVYKKSAVPTRWEADSVYYIKNGLSVQCFVTDDNGNPLPVIPDDGDSIVRETADPTSALKVVWEDEDGVVRPLDYRDDLNIDKLCGLTITASSATGMPVTVKRGGVLNATGLGLVAGRVWLGIDGALTQVPPEDGYDVLVGYATAEQRIYLQFDDSIDMEI